MVFITAVQFTPLVSHDPDINSFVAMCTPYTTSVSRCSFRFHGPYSVILHFLRINQNFHIKTDVMECHQMTICLHRCTVNQALAHEIHRTYLPFSSSVWEWSLYTASICVVPPFAPFLTYASICHILPLCDLHKFSSTT